MIVLLYKIEVFVSVIAVTFQSVFIRKCIKIFFFIFKKLFLTLVQ